MRYTGFHIPVTAGAGPPLPYTAMLVLTGAAIASSPINVTLLPLILGFLIARRAPLRLWLLPLLSFLVALAGLRLAGLPWTDLGTLYVGQAGASPKLSTDAPSIWAILQALPWINQLPFAGLALASAVGSAAWLTARFAWRRPSARELLASGTATSLILVGLLPGMHWNSFLPVTALAVLTALLLDDRRSWMAAALVVTGTSFGLVGHLTKTEAWATAGAVPMIIATALIARRFLTSPANDNGLPLNPFRAYPA